VTFDVDFRKTEPFEMNSVYSMVGVNGSLIWNDNQMQGWRENDIFYFEGRENGIDFERELTVLYSTEDTLVVYYCVNSMGLESSGVLVMSSVSRLKPERVARV
jgi:hypothetical protein